MQTRVLLLAAIAACNPVVAHLPDADMKHDSAIDAPPSPVTVTVLDLQGTGAPTPGVPVVFINPDGTAVAHPVTDATGKASAVVQAGASVSVVFQPSPTGWEVFTIQAVKPGDNLTVGSTYDYTDIAPFTVRFSAATGATYYYIYGPCGSVQSTTPGTPVTLSMQKSCKQDTMEIQVRAFTAAGLSAGYVSMTGVALANGSVSMPSTYNTYVSVSASYMGLTGVTSVESVRYAPADNNYQTDPATTNPGGSSTTNIVTGPASPTAAMQTYFYGPNGAQQRLIEPLGGSATTYSVDAATTLLPWIGAVSFDLSGKITVPLDHTGTTNDAPDFFDAQASYGRMIDASTFYNFVWIVVGPTPGDVTLPKLPADLAFINPKPTDSPSFPQAVMVESSAVNGWDEVRPNLFTVVNGFTALRGSTAKVRMSQSNNPN